jgi:hypothetical protein
MTATIEKRALIWISREDKGISSETIWVVMMLGEDAKQSWCSVPWDPSDFGRCHRLLEYIPEWRERLHEVAELFPAWGPLVAHWDEMTRLYLRDEPTGESRELYNLMKMLTRPEAA